MADGRALLAGGCAVVSCPSFGTEIHDPVRQRWAIDASMNVARYDHAGIRLPDGRIVLAGGLDRRLNQLSSAELYTPGHN